MDRGLRRMTPLDKVHDSGKDFFASLHAIFLGIALQEGVTCLAERREPRRTLCAREGRLGWSVNKSATPELLRLLSGMLAMRGSVMVGQLVGTFEHT